MFPTPMPRLTFRPGSSLPFPLPVLFLTATATTPAAEKDRFAGQLASGFAGMSAEDKELLAGMPGMLAGLRATRPELSEDARARAVARWSELAPAKLPVGRVKALRNRAEGERVGKLMREQDARQMLFHTGALRMNHAYIQW